MKYLISIAVATKNRYTYLKHLINLIDSYRFPELEFVIHDNSDDNSEILSFLSSFDNPNLKYYYTSDTLTMSQNGELAIKKTNGEYVCYIGDDDGVCRNIVDCVKWMKKKGVEVAYNKNTWFMWGKSAKLLWRRNKYSLYDTKSELISLSEKGGNLPESNLPLLYHGIVRRAVIDDILTRYGTLFPSVPPDISGSICLATVVDKCCELTIPVIINGISTMSGGGVLNKGGVLDLEEVSFITQKEIDEWDKRIPPVWCGHYAWANSAIKTYENIGLHYLSDNINVDYCLSKATSLRPHIKRLWQMGFKYAENRAYFVMLTIYEIVRRYMKKITDNLPVLVKKENKIENIIEAEKFFYKYYRSF